jgi:hypothetical protein
LWFCGSIFKLNDLCLPPWHGIFSTFAAIIAKHDCAIQFILTVKLEKMIVKSKQNSQHHSTHSDCSKTLIWRPSSNIPALAAILVPVNLAFASCKINSFCLKPSSLFLPNSTIFVNFSEFYTFA